MSDTFLGITFAPYNDYTITLKSGEKVTGRFERMDAEMITLGPKHGRGETHFIAKTEIAMVTKANW